MGGQFDKPYFYRTKCDSPPSKFKRPAYIIRYLAQMYKIAKQLHDDP